MKEFWEFVRELLTSGDTVSQCMERRERMKRIIAERWGAEKIEVRAVTGGRRVRPIPGLRSELAAHLVEVLGISSAEIARHLGVSPSAITRIPSRRQRKSP